MLTVQSEAAKRKGRRWVRCLCECGETTEVDLAKLRYGTTISCGCFRSSRFTTHGMSRTSMYSSWIHMRRRAGSNPYYVDVAVCPEWDTFEGFVANQPVQGVAWFDGAHIARFGDTGDYTPDNTRWATHSENSREMAEQRMSRLPDGRLASDVAVENGINRSTFRNRVFSGWDLERAATEPPQKRRPGPIGG